jgi:hypothetical protein
VPRRADRCWNLGVGVPRQDRTNTVTSDARLWHPWLRINRVLRVILNRKTAKAFD